MNWTHGRDVGSASLIPHLQLLKSKLEGALAAEREELRKLTEMVSHYRK